MNKENKELVKWMAEIREDLTFESKVQLIKDFWVSKDEVPNFLKKYKANNLEEVVQITESIYKENNQLKTKLEEFTQKYQELLNKIELLDLEEKERTEYNLQDFLNWLKEQPKRKGYVDGKIVRKSNYNKMLRKITWQEFLMDDEKRAKEKEKLKNKNRLELLKMVEVFETWISTL